MAIEVKKSDSGVVFKVTDRSLSDEAADTLKSEALKVIEEGHKRILLDLSDTSYIDSSGIGKLLFINKKLSSLGGVLEIDKINRTLLNFLESLTITKVIKVNNR